MLIFINHLTFYSPAIFLYISIFSYQVEAIILFMVVSGAVSAKSVATKKMENQVDDGNDSWADWDHGEVKQIMIEKKVPVFVEKIRHVPVVQKEYISVPRYITKPIYIERSVPIIIPRMQHYHHHHYSEIHHMHWILSCNILW